MQKDGFYSELQAHCNGASALIVAALSCTIPTSVLEEEPYSLLLGDSVYAVVSAFNSYGESLSSDAGTGATILHVPSSPVTLTVIGTSASVISFSW
jgi:hypothetical protein